MQTDVLVVGGGVIGASAALHLAQAGADVTLVERDGFGQATSSAGAGFVGEWAAGWIPTMGPEELALERYGLAFYAQLAADGVEFDYRQNGNFFLAGTQETWESYCAPMTTQVDLVPDVQRVDAGDVELMTGGLVPNDRVFAAAYLPSGAQVTAGKAAVAIATNARAAGARMEEREPVTRILVSDGRVTGVETADGRIDAERVVVAAGPWTNVLLRGVGVQLPMAPLLAIRVVTEPRAVPATMPTIMVREHAFYVREHQGRLLWGGAFSSRRGDFTEEDPPERLSTFPMEGALEMRQTLERAAAMMPSLLDAQSMTASWGAPTYTADRRALLGPVPGIEGLLVACGCNETGITHAPGFGKLLSELLVDGEATLTSVEPFRIDRFGDVPPRPEDIGALYLEARAKPAKQESEAAAAEVRG